MRHGQDRVARERNPLLILPAGPEQDARPWEVTTKTDGAQEPPVVTTPTCPQRQLVALPKDVAVGVGPCDPVAVGGVEVDAGLRGEAARKGEAATEEVRVRDDDLVDAAVVCM